MRFFPMCLTLLVVLGALTPSSAGDPADIPTTIVIPEGANSRYPYRIPDWLWTNPDFCGFVDEDLREEIEADIRQMESLRGIEGETASKTFDRLEELIAEKLSKRFVVQDLTAGGQVLVNKPAGQSLVVLIDPKFSAASHTTIQRGADLFIQVGARLDVIQKAIDQSIPNPQPQPKVYQIENNEPILDRYGNKKFDPEYQFYRECRSLPPSADFLRAQLLEAMPSVNDDPGLLVISHYVGNAWWGGGYYNSYYHEPMRLKRKSSSRGYLYIRLNEDQMQQNVPHSDDPAFWAGKIAHEVLHNFNYWHPSYTDPDERDRLNPENQKAFIYAYEQEVTAAANQLLTQRPVDSSPE